MQGWVAGWRGGAEEEEEEEEEGWKKRIYSYSMRLKRDPGRLCSLRIGGGRERAKEGKQAKEV
jgi:hypothetical protein